MLTEKQPCLNRTQGWFRLEKNQKTNCLSEWNIPLKTHETINILDSKCFRPVDEPPPSLPEWTLFSSANVGKALYSSFTCSFILSLSLFLRGRDGRFCIQPSWTLLGEIQLSRVCVSERVCSDQHVSATMQGQMVWAGKASVAVPALKGFDPCVFAVMPCQLVRAGELPCAAVPGALVWLLTWWR